MDTQRLKDKRNEWLRRYIPAEIIGTITALTGAWIVYAQTNSYVASAAVGLIGEGIGFFGYFITIELLNNRNKYTDSSKLKRIVLIISSASQNLIVEFLPAEIIDNLLIRPFAMYIAPTYVHPYPLGFLAGKFSADILFYAIAILGYETKKRIVR
jgi:hypothetical protein